MKIKLISIFFINLFLLSSFSMMAQEEGTTVNDSLIKHHKYGLRVGADLSKPLRSFLEDGYTGFELVADFRISRRFYLAAEIGTEEKEYNESNLAANTSGSYVKLGADFNAYNNWFGMDNAITTGLRYGFSTFKQELLGYGIYTTNNIFPGNFIDDPQEFSGLTAHWAELIIAVKTELINNLYLSINLQLKSLISEDRPENFDNLYIPGFNRTYDFSEFGVGYGYTISYLIPIFKK
jgi:hypothetical protein